MASGRCPMTGWTDPLESFAIVTGLTEEAKILHRAIQACGAGHHRVLCLGPGPERAGKAAEQLVAEMRPNALVSCGYAGALTAGMASGSLFLPEDVVDEAGRIMPCAARMRERIRKRLAGKVPIHSQGRLLSTVAPVTTTAARQDCASRFKASVVDMESAAIAAVAQRHGLLFFALRVVLDAHDQDIPAPALKAMRPDGRTSPWHAVLALMAAPRTFPAMFRLARASRTARSALAHSARALVLKTGVLVNEGGPPRA